MDTEIYNFPSTVEQTGHGGGDFGIMRDLVNHLQFKNQPGTSARQSLESHFMAFAAEESRLENTKINMAEFREKYEAGASPY
jgi:hypothetical protein